LLVPEDQFQQLSMVHLVSHFFIWAASCDLSVTGQITERLAGMEICRKLRWMAFASL